MEAPPISKERDLKDTLDEECDHANDSKDNLGKECEVTKSLEFYEHHPFITSKLQYIQNSSGLDPQTPALWTISGLQTTFPIFRL